MFRNMRRSEKLMSIQDTVKVLQEAEYGTFATVGDNGYPYSVPLNYVYEKDTIYFHSAHTGNKIENIKMNHKVGFSVVSYHKLLPDKFDTEYDSAILFGTGSEVIHEQEKRHALQLFIEKYSRDYFAEGTSYIDKAIHAVAVYKIQVDHMSGKRGR